MGVSSISPSWADEFLVPIFKKFPNKVILKKEKTMVGIIIAIAVLILILFAIKWAKEYLEYADFNDDYERKKQRWDD